MSLATLPEIRALTVFDHVPAGCILRLVTDDDSDPHLRAGEFAVIDTTDREPQHGELYEIRWLRGDTSIVQAISRMFNNSQRGMCLGWWTRTLRRDDFDAEMAKPIPRGTIRQISHRAMIDGPRYTETFKEALIGRVIGIYQAAAEMPALASAQRSSPNA